MLVSSEGFAYPSPISQEPDLNPPRARSEPDLSYPVVRRGHIPAPIGTRRHDDQTG
jgi:hypothetical protein